MSGKSKTLLLFLNSFNPFCQQ